MCFLDSDPQQVVVKYKGKGGSSPAPRMAGYSAFSQEEMCHEFL